MHFGDSVFIGEIHHFQIQVAFQILPESQTKKNTLHPRKLRWNPKMEVWFRWFSFSKGRCSGSMLKTSNWHQKEAGGIWLAMAITLCLVLTTSCQDFCLKRLNVIARKGSKSSNWILFLHIYIYSYLFIMSIHIFIHWWVGNSEEYKIRKGLQRRNKDLISSMLCCPNSSALLLTSKDGCSTFWYEAMLTTQQCHLMTLLCEVFLLGLPWFLQP